MNTDLIKPHLSSKLIKKQISQTYLIKTPHIQIACHRSII
jgi:hypothetical protein